MANGKIQQYADLITLQVAAEAFWKEVANLQGQTERQVVFLNGNESNSLNPQYLIELFSAATARFRLIEIANI